MRARENESGKTRAQVEVAAMIFQLLNRGHDLRSPKIRTRESKDNNNNKFNPQASFKWFTSSSCIECIYIYIYTHTHTRPDEEKECQEQCRGIEHRAATPRGKQEQLRMLYLSLLPLPQLDTLSFPSNYKPQPLRLVRDSIIRLGNEENLNLLDGIRIILKSKRVIRTHRHTNDSLDRLAH